MAQRLVGCLAIHGLEAEEEGPRPDLARDQTGDGRERAMALAAEEHTVLDDRHLMGGALPFPQQNRAGTKRARSVRHERRAFPGQGATDSGLEPAEGALLQAVGHRPDQQRPRSPRRRRASVESGPPLDEAVAAEPGESLKLLAQRLMIGKRKAAHAALRALPIW